MLEGEAFHNELTVSKHFGLLTKKSKTRTNDYFFDNIEVSGNIGVNNDSIAPEIFGLIILGERSLELSFTEEVDISEAEFIVKLNDDEVSGFTHTLSEDKTRVTLNMPREIEADILYTVEAINVKDLVGNYLEVNNWAQTAYARTPETSDLSFNEVMFENPEGSFEYVEIVNLTDKLLNMNGLIITTRNSDGNFETGNQFQVSYIQPQGLIAITENASAVLEHHKCPKYANVVNTEWNRTLKNDKNTIYLLTPDYEYMYDSMSYDAKWHHPLIRNAKGVSLEKINPTFDSATPSAWQSASSETHYGTPGHRNSQLRNPENKLDEEKYIRLDPEAFSPDGDGFEDLCYIYFEMPSSGFVANLSIYTPTGLQLCRIVENGVIGTEGNFIWNGLTQQGTNAEVGVYVLIFEAFNTNTGETIIRKMPIVINGR